MDYFLMSPLVSRGYVYATTGEGYTNLARRSARNLRQVMPNAQIDLFTDQNITDPVFNQIHALERVSHRPKMEAMRRSRFRRTVMLDADAFPIVPVNDLFDLAGLYDLAATSTFIRPWAVYGAQKHIPRAFPYLNAGVLAFRKTPHIIALATAWEKAVLDHNQPIDQPALRELIFSMKTRFMVLPREYNLIYLKSLDHWPAIFGIPRILHVRDLHDRPMGDPEQPIGLVEALGETHAATVQAMLDAKHAAKVAKAAKVASQGTP